MEHAVGYVFDWEARGVRPVGAEVERVHQVVSRRLGEDPALAELVAEARAAVAELSADTRQWLTLSLNAVAKRDAEFAAALLAAVEAVRAAERAAGVSATDRGIAIGGNVSIRATGPGSVAALRIDGPVSTGLPTPVPPTAPQG
ncbi:hypothetical protein ACIQBJ_06595 [Kitasatospora sp. NPDC088391]|uniref:hypothetical protein n=1 Tax=Kitasatospora sp. NPDC088391 TaxID=3364074 RepID=UPI0038227AC2